jgi:mono/diheme cytochrome c family protein
MFVPVLFLAALVMGCQGGKEAETSKQPAEQAEQPAQPPAETPAAEGAPEAGAGNPVEEAKDIFATRCATCHGQEGRGDGPGAKLLNPKPQNFHDKQWQAATDDKTIATAIVYGGAAVGKSPLMASNPDLQGKPKVVDALIAHIRELGKQP